MTNKADIPEVFTWTREGIHWILSQGDEAVVKVVRTHGCGCSRGLSYDAKVIPGSSIRRMPTSYWEPDFFPHPIWLEVNEPIPQTLESAMRQAERFVRGDFGVIEA